MASARKSVSESLTICRMFWGYKIVRSQTITDIQRGSVSRIFTGYSRGIVSTAVFTTGTDASGMSQSGSMLRKKVLPQRIVQPVTRVIRARSVQGHVTHIVFILSSVDSSLLSSCNVLPIWLTLH